MTEHNFKASLYGTYKWIALDGGVFAAMIIVIVFLRNHPINRDVLFLLAFFILAMLVMAISRSIDYFSLDNDYFIIHKFFSKTKIPVKDLKTLGYRTNLVSFGLIVGYSQDNQQRDKTYEVSAYEPETLKSMNDALTSVNQNLSVDIDGKAEQFLIAESSRKRMVPTTKIGWARFLLTWFLLSFAITWLFFYFGLGLGK